MWRGDLSVVGREWLLMQVFDQGLLTLQLTPPTSGHGQQSIQIKMHALCWQRLQQINGGHFLALVQKRLKGHLNLLPRDVSIHQHKIST